MGGVPRRMPVVQGGARDLRPRDDEVEPRGAQARSGRGANPVSTRGRVDLGVARLKAAGGALLRAWDIVRPTRVIALSMTNSEDDDQDIADHGTVIMDRKAASGIPRPAANQSRSRPSPPPILPAAGSMPTTPAAPPAGSAASTGLPVLPPSISGVAPSPSASSAAASSSNKRLAALVAFGSFTVVFVIGALIMILIRVARDSADDAPRPNNAVQTKPTGGTRTTGK